MKIAPFVGLIVLVLCSMIGVAEADIMVVVPLSDTAIEGNSDNFFPFSAIPPVAPSMRYQQVYGATDFVPAVLFGPQYITQVAFRPDGDFRFANAFSSTISSIQIDLSTTSTAPDGLSTTFANNVGADDTVVFPKGPLPLSSSDTGPARGPKDFDIVVNLQTPFRYDPTQGNLLLDVRNFSGGETTGFDAEATPGDTVSRVYADDVTASVGTTDTIGLVTRFTFGAAPVVPEPPTGALVGVGAGMMFAYRSLWTRRRRGR